MPNPDFSFPKIRKSSIPGEKTLLNPGLQPAEFRKVSPPHLAFTVRIEDVPGP